MTNGDKIVEMTKTTIPAVKLLKQTIFAWLF
jgi:hypothetical protein